MTVIGGKLVEVAQVILSIGTRRGIGVDTIGVEEEKKGTDSEKVTLAETKYFVNVDNNNGNLSES